MIPLTLAAVAVAASAPLATAANIRPPTLRFNTTFSPFDGLFHFSSDRGHNATWRHTWDGKGRYAGSESSPNLTFAFEGTGVWIHGYGAVPDHVATLKVDGLVSQPNIATHISRGFAGCGSAPELAFGVHDVFFTFPIGGVAVDGILVETEISSAETSIDSVPRRVEMTLNNGQRSRFFAADDLWKQHDEGLELEQGVATSSATLTFEIPKGVSYLMINGSVGPRYTDGEIHFDPPLSHRPHAVVPYHANGTLPRRGVLWAGNLDPQRQYSVSLRPGGQEDLTAGKARVHSVTMLLTENPGSKRRVSVGAIVGGVLGGAAFLGAAGMLLWYPRRQKTITNARNPVFEIEAAEPMTKTSGAPLSLVPTLPDGHSPEAGSARTTSASDSSWTNRHRPLPVTKEGFQASPSFSLSPRISCTAAPVDMPPGSPPLPLLCTQNESQDSIAPMLGAPTWDRGPTQSIPLNAANHTTLWRLTIPASTSHNVASWPEPSPPTSPLSPTNFDPSAEVTIEVDAEDAAAAAETLALGNNNLPPYRPANSVGITTGGPGTAS